MHQETLLVGLAHPDDELGAAGTILAQRARGDRVVIVWLTRGEMTDAFGRRPIAEIAERRTAQGVGAGKILDVEVHFMDFVDTHLAATREAAVQVARLIADIRPTGLLTWGDAWVRGMRHPDHQATGTIFRDAITLARLASVVGAATPHRENVPTFTLRDVHSALPCIGVDVTPYRAKIEELASYYLQGVGFGDPEWLEQRLRLTGDAWGCRYAEEFDAWETVTGSRATTLIPAQPLAGLLHPTRQGAVDQSRR